MSIQTLQSCWKIILELKLTSRWVNVSKLSENSPKTKIVRRHKSDIKRNRHWAKKGWTYCHANLLYPARFQKSFGKEICFAVCQKEKPGAEVMKFFWRSRYERIYLIVNNC